MVKIDWSDGQIICISSKAGFRWLTRFTLSGIYGIELKVVSLFKLSVGMIKWFALGV